MDICNNFFYVYTGAYEQTLSTIYRGRFSSGSILNPRLVDNISLERMGWVNFDVEVSFDGNSLYFVDGRFDENGGPYESNLTLAIKEADKFFRADDAEEIFRNINTSDLEYAAAVTRDELEICFTRVRAPLTAQSEPKIYLADRQAKTEPFTHVRQIENFTGFVEAATYTPDDRGIYFHKKEEGRHRLYFARKR
jgi:Tol biopolymer transport system component